MRDSAGLPTVRREAGNVAVPAVAEAVPADVQRRLTKLERRVAEHHGWVAVLAEHFGEAADGWNPHRRNLEALAARERKVTDESLGRVAAELAELRDVTLSSQDRAKARALSALADLEAAAGRFATDPPAFSGAGPLTTGSCAAFARSPIDLGAFAPEAER